MIVQDIQRFQFLSDCWKPKSAILCADGDLVFWSKNESVAIETSEHRRPSISNR